MRALARVLVLAVYTAVMIGFALLVQALGWKYAAGILTGIALIDGAHYVKYRQHVDF